VTDLLSELGARSSLPVGLGIGGARTEMTDAAGAPFGSVEIAGYEVRCGFVPVEPPTFDPGDEHRDGALVRVRTFSCNYRDRALTLWMSVLPRPRGFYLIGSELGGEVVAVGDAVVNVRPGDRVMIDGYFGTGTQPWGLPTNHTSRELQVLPARKLVVVPERMSDVEAAAFSVGAQTSYSMVRRGGIEPGANVLVTAATSNTSLFLAQAARNAGGDVTMTTGSEAKAERVRNFGFERVFVVPRDDAPFDGTGDLADHARDLEGFDAVLDPYFDLHLNRSLPVLASFGRYVTCGFERQFPEAGTTSMAPESVLDSSVLARALERNVAIVANCLGSTADLEHAVDDFTKGRITVPIDSVMDADSPAAFLRRTFSDPDRFGKVVCRYS